ncbi:MAG: hypothetical protein M1542_08470 [Thermotogae bacterium]|jgi:hypothetical protein|nr:hypothetical protein [Thermotogota bacterium]
MAGGLCPGNILTQDGTTVSGSDLCLNPTQISKLQSSYKSAVNSGQSSSQAFQTAASQVYTSSGNTLADALQLFQTAINLHGGPANANLSTSSIANAYVQSAISPQTLSNILAGTSSTTSRYGSSTSSGNPQLNLSSPSVLIPLAIVGFPILLMLFFSTANLPQKKIYYTNPNQVKI